MTRLISAFLGVLTGPGRLVAFAALVILALVRGLNPPLFEEIRLRSFDLEQRLAPRSHEALPVVIVEIDEASLAEPYGQWPWPRTLVAKLVQTIAVGRPAALGVDIIFSEPDRLSPERIGDSVPGLSPETVKALAGMRHSDAELADAIRSVPTVLGVGVTFEAPPAGAVFVTPPTIVPSADPKPFLEAFPALVRSLPEIAAAGRGQGALVGNPDQDGVLRRVPLFVVAGGNLVAGLSVETLRVALGGRIGIAVTRSGIAGARVGDYVLPTDTEGRAYPWFAPPQSSTIVSAADLLNGSFDPAQLAGKVVLLGVTGLGLVDLKETPVGLMQGIEVQAQLVESAVSGVLLRRPIGLPAIELALALAISAIVIFALPYRRPRVAAALLLAIVVACLGTGFVAFRVAHLLLDGVYPAFASIMTFGIMLAAELRVAEQARRALAGELERERDIKARLEGELNAARAIQKGLLPRHLPAVPETRSIDLHALVETARMVGGDLYDFMMIDSYRLFFAIADVSGKGVDAALFMAVTKLVLNAAALQYGEALDRVFDEANLRIAASSADTQMEGGRPMFVTVFAAVLDLTDGTLFYVSAGHDSPYVLRAGMAPRRLETEGGPPLGTVDDFRFPVDRAQLAPGDLLLLFTDGVTEAKDKADAFYSSARLARLVSAMPIVSAKSVVEHVREDVGRFVGDAEQADDITLLAVRWLGPDPG